jgi:hypothetical protein
MVCVVTAAVIMFYMILCHTYSITTLAGWISFAVRGFGPHGITFMTYVLL